MKKPTYAFAALAKSDAKLNIEIWRDIPHYKGYYQASNLGRIRSMPREIKNISTMKVDYKTRLKGKIIKQHHQPDDYTLVTLHKNGDRHMVTVAKMIAKIFLPNPHHYTMVTHYNGNHADNNLTNLDWCSKAASHRREPLRHGSSVSLSKHNFKQTFLSQSAAAIWLKTRLSLNTEPTSILRQVERHVKSGKPLYGFHIKSVSEYRRNHVIIAIFQHRFYHFTSKIKAAKWLKFLSRTQASLTSLEANIDHCCRRTKKYYHEANHIIFYFKDRPASAGKLHTKTLIAHTVLYNSDERHEFNSEINAARWLKKAVNTPINEQTIASEISNHIYRQTMYPLFGRFMVKITKNRG